MKNLIELSHTELLLTFAASCVEGVARRLGIGYHEAFVRMKKVDIIDNYIIPFYDVLHLESRTNLIDNVVDSLLKWEAEK